MKRYVMSVTELSRIYLPMPARCDVRSVTKAVDRNINKGYDGTVTSYLLSFVFEK